jgi:hypothetical protein
METMRQVEEEAKRRGVVLASAARAEPVADQVVQSRGWLAKVMPHGANLMAALKAQLDPDIYAGVLDKMRRGGGYVVDHTTNIAVGSPPLDEYERGRMQTRDGFAVMRVRPKVRS